MVAIAAATALRSVGGVAVLFVGTVLLGVAVTVGNVLLPAVVKQRFPRRAGTVTGIYTAALIGGAAVTAAASVPLAGVVGWRLGLGAWALLAALSLAGLLEARSAWPLWAAAGGLAVGAALATATTLIVVRTHHAAATRRLSAMAQTVAYAIAASGPVVVGGLYGATGSWSAPLILLIAVAGVMAAAGTVSGREVLIDEEPVPAA